MRVPSGDLFTSVRRRVVRFSRDCGSRSTREIFPPACTCQCLGCARSRVDTTATLEGRCCACPGLLLSGRSDVPHTIRSLFTDLPVSVATAMPTRQVYAKALLGSDFLDSAQSWRSAGVAQIGTAQTEIGTRVCSLSK